MDRIGEFAPPIRSVLEIHPGYTAIAISLGFFVYRWNSNRVGQMIRATTSLCHAEADLQVKIPTYGSQIPVLSFISAVRLIRGTKEILADGYKRVEFSIEPHRFTSHVYYSIQFSESQLLITGLLSCLGNIQKNFIAHLMTSLIPWRQ